MVLKALYLYSDDMRSINVGNEKLPEKKKKKKDRAVFITLFPVL